LRTQIIRKSKQTPGILSVQKENESLDFVKYIIPLNASRAIQPFGMQRFFGKLFLINSLAALCIRHQCFINKIFPEFEYD
jgi:hypothetical protein